MKTLKSALLVAALLTSGSAFAATNLLTNGNFDNSTLSGLSGGTNYWIVYPSNSNILGWTVGATSVDLIQAPHYGGIPNNLPSPAGLSVDLAGSPGPGSISQSFDTIAGYSYILTFDMSSNGKQQNGTYWQANVTFGELDTDLFTVINPAIKYLNQAAYFTATCAK